MSITLSAWAIPLAVTIAVWLWGTLAPMPARQGDYDFGGSVVGAIRLAVCVTVTLAAWLIYFATRVAVGV